MATQVSGNGIWSWWGMPVSVKRDGNIYFTAVTIEGYWRIFKNDSTSYVTLGTGNEDDHNTPCMVNESGKPLVVFYTQHGVTTTVKYKICGLDGSGNLDWPNFGSQQTITFPNGTTYVQAITDSANDTIYLFTRSSEQQWYFAKSEDWGQTWDDPVLFFETAVTGARMYCLLQPSESESGVFHLAAYGHPSDDWKTIRYGKIDISTGTISTYGNSNVANLDGTGLPLDEHSLEQAYTPSGTRRARLLDIGDKEGKSVLLYARWDDTTTIPEYCYAVRNDSTGVWSHTYITSSGGTFDPVEARKYVPGMCLDRNGNNWIYLGRKLSTTWKMERYDLNSSLAVTGSSTVMTDSDKWLVRPIATRGSDGMRFCRLISYNGFDDYQSHIYKNV